MFGIRFLVSDRSLETMQTSLFYLQPATIILTICHMKSTYLSKNRLHQQLGRMRMAKKI